MATQVETVVVPDVHGYKEDIAVAQLADSGLHAGEGSAAADPLPEGYVVSTDPRAGSSVTRGTVVDYTVSLGPETDPTPGLLPTPPLTVGPTEDPRPEWTPRPTPFPSSEVALVADFTCLDLPAARDHLEAAGLLVGAVIPEDPAPPEDWLVHDQLPKPGASVPVGSRVDLMLGDPLDPLSPC